MSCEKQLTGVLHRVQWLLEIMGHVRNIVTQAIPLNNSSVNLKQVGFMNAYLVFYTVQRLLEITCHVRNIVTRTVPLNNSSVNLCYMVSLIFDCHKFFIVSYIFH